MSLINSLLLAGFFAPILISLLVLLPGLLFFSCCVLAVVFFVKRTKQLIQ